jgi:hypothetical protein
MARVPAKYNPEDMNNEPLSSGVESVKATTPGDRGGSISLTPGQMRQVAFIHSVTSARCACGDAENCRDCNTTAQMKELAGRHLGYF